MKNKVYGLCCCTTIVSLIYFFALNAETKEIKEPNSSDAISCTKEELMTFFPQQVVQSVLVKANIEKKQASIIANELSKKERELAKIVEEKAEKLDPNPFKDLTHRDLAIKIYRETLYEVFAKVLKANGLTNDDQIQTLLDNMQAAKSKLFIECIRKQQQQQQQVNSSTPTS